MRRMLGTIVGGAIVVFVIANVQFGAVAPLAVNGVDEAKLDVFMLSDPSCGFDAIEAEIEAMGTSYCLGEKGQWSGADILMLVEGIIIILAGRLELPQNKAWARRVRKVGFITGCTLFSLAILDRLEWLPSSANSQGLADLFPLDVSPWMVQIGFAVAGTLLMRGPKYWEAEAVAQTREKLENRREKAGKFRGSFQSKEKHDQKTHDRHDRSRLLSNDKNLSMSRRRSNLLVMATCPYCQGGGCKKCKELGVF